MKKYNGITDKQKEARIKNFAKGRMKGALANIENVVEITANLSDLCKKRLTEAHWYLTVALKNWDIKD